mgnify:FL=1
MVDVKVGIIVSESDVRDIGVEAAAEYAKSILEHYIDVGLRKFYIIIPETGRYAIVGRVIDSGLHKEAEVVFREIYGEDGGGGLLSLVPFLYYSEKMIVNEIRYFFKDYLYEYYVDLLDKTEYPIIFLGKTVDPPYAKLQGDRILYFVKTLRDIVKYGYIGLSILTYRFFNFISGEHLIYPDLHVREATELFNLYLSKGGILKAEILMDMEWSRL